MAITDYVDPNDSGSQAEILQVVGNQENAGGMCLMLSINWAINCSQPGAKAPNVVWADMRDNIKSKAGQAYLKQIAQQQIGYTRHFNTGGWFQSATDLVDLGSRKARQVKQLTPDDSFTTSAAMATRIAEGLAASTTTPPLVLIIFKCSGGAHGIAAAKVGNTLYIFDPNYGVMIVDPGKNRTPAGATAELFSGYTISNGLVIPIVTG